MATITQLKAANNTDIRVKNTPNSIDTDDVADLLDALADEFLNRGVLVADDTTALSINSGANTKVVFVKNNGLFVWAASGVPNGTTIFAATGGGVYTRYLANNTAGGTIDLANHAWVEVGGNDGTGAIGDPASPYATVDAVLDDAIAFSTIVIHLGIGEFARIDETKIRSGMSLLGSKMPRLNNTVVSTALGTVTETTPTALIDGTIIKGGMQIRNKENLTFKDLGIDNGSDFVGLGNDPYDCLDIRDAGTNSGATPPFTLMKNIHVENVACLGDNYTSLFHAMTFENCYVPYVKNVLLVGNTHGLANKTAGGTYDGIVSYWHETDDAIFKINNYAPAHEMICTNFTFRSLSQTAKESGGLCIQNETGTLARLGCIFANGTISYTKEGIRDYANADYQGMNISKVNIYKTANSGIYLVGMAKGLIEGCIIDGTGGNGVWLPSSTGGNTVQGCMIINQTTYDGITVSGGANKTYLLNNYIANNVGTGIACGDANVFGENNVLVGNGVTISGTLNLLLTDVLAGTGNRLMGISSTGLRYRTTIDPAALAGGWGLTGNASTNPSTNFIGTTDNVAFNIRSNNIVRMNVSGGGNFNFNAVADAGYEYLFAAYGVPGFFRIGYGNVSQSGVSIGTDVNFSDYARLRIIGFSDTVPHLWIGNGGNDSYAKWFAYTGYGLGFECNNYTGLPFTNKGYQEFQDRTYFGGALGARATAFVHIAAGVAGAAQIRLVAGVAPTAPNDGDIWREDNTNTGLKIRVNGVTKTVTLS